MTLPVEYDEAAAVQETTNHDDDEGFANYEVDTIDTAPWALIVTTLVSLLMIAAIPLCVRIGNRMDQIRTTRQQRRQNQQQQDPKDLPEPPQPVHSQPLEEEEAEENDEALPLDEHDTTNKQYPTNTTTTTNTLSSRTLSQCPTGDPQKRFTSPSGQECVLVKDPNGSTTMASSQKPPHEHHTSSSATKSDPLSLAEDKDNKEHEIVFLRQNSGLDAEEDGSVVTAMSALSVPVGTEEVTAAENDKKEKEDESVVSSWTNFIDTLSFQGGNSTVSATHPSSSKPTTTTTPLATTSSSPVPPAAAVMGPTSSWPLSRSSGGTSNQDQENSNNRTSHSYLPSFLQSLQTATTPVPITATKHRSSSSKTRRRTREHVQDHDNEGVSVTTSNSNRSGKSQRRRKHGNVVDDDGSVSSSSRGSVMSFTGLAYLEEAMTEYVTTKELWHPKARDVRRIQGGGQVIQALLHMGHAGDEDDDDDNVSSSRSTNEHKKTTKTDHSVSSVPSKGGPADEPEKMDDNQSKASSSSTSSSSDGRRTLTVSSWKKYKFYKCDGDTRGIVKLALPFTIHTFVVHVFELMEVAIIGRLVGTEELSALFIVDTVLSLATMFMEGALTSLFTLCSHAVGAQRYYLAGQYVQIGVVFYQALLLPMGVILWFYLEDIVLLFGFEQEVADIAVSYAQVEFVSYLFNVYREGLDHILEVTEHEVFTACFTITEGIVAFFATFFYAKYSSPSLRDIALLGLALDVVSTVIFVAILVHKGWLKDYWGGMIGNFAPANTQALRIFCKTALPLSIGFVMSTGEWEVLTVLAGFMGPAEVSAWGLLGWFWEAIEEISLAIADAAEVKVGKMLGSGQPYRARSMGNKSLYLGTILSLLFSIPIIAMKDILPGFFTTDETLQTLLTDLFPLVAVGNIALMFGSMCWSILGAQGRYALATAVGFIGSWGLTLPLASIFALAFNFDLQAMVGSVVVGYACSGSLNAVMLIRSDWEQLSANVIKDTNKGAGLADGTEPLSSNIEEEAYDDFDWDELPEHGTCGVTMRRRLDCLVETNGRCSPFFIVLFCIVRSAASLLGYSKKMWDADKEPPSSEFDWDDLEPEQKEAASMLGYNKCKWDSED